MFSFGVNTSRCSCSKTEQKLFLGELCSTNGYSKVHSAFKRPVQKLKLRNLVTPVTAVTVVEVVTEVASVKVVEVFIV